MRYVHVTRGVALKQLNRLSEAESEFQAEIKQFPDEPEGYWNLLVLYVEAKQQQPAEQLIGFLLTKRQSPTSFMIVADALATTGQIQAAQQIAREGLKRYPGNPLLERVSRVQ